MALRVDAGAFRTIVMGNPEVNRRVQALANARLQGAHRPGGNGVP